MLIVGAVYFVIMLAMLFSGYFNTLAFLLLSVLCSLVIRRIPKEKDSKWTTSAGFLFILAAIIVVAVKEKDSFF
ncbi:hypothetical protein [Lysinibacillus odysseyi]|uniref:DUF3953 domain-containing protein n=1 Tax=Lysinibacillus odysseyi 34hs-1 = NBRC 100172 TaxID=1220589 RepID=A0A0A3II00_9BACI|nr:hypothetical protein [Lysinibacillus odysseyi]KGR84396.1 hypothetical protein CD32_12450 [Lysinibacillus odysseyi 34hs-1 = NBRC 100172]